MAYFTRTRERVYGGPSFLGMIWLIVGCVVAATHDYFVDVNTGKEILSAILAVLLWPLLLIGINLHVH
jgi:lipopolysaccharide export LptBFGC system permease protein LptF